VKFALSRTFPGFRNSEDEDRGQSTRSLLKNRRDARRDETSLLHSFPPLATLCLVGTYSPCTILESHPLVAKGEDIERKRERERERESITFDGTTCSALSSFFLKRRPNSFHGSRPPPPPPSLWRIRIRYKAAKWSVGRGQRKAKGEEAPVHPGGAWADVERTWGAGRARGGGGGGGEFKSNFDVGKSGRC